MLLANIFEVSVGSISDNSNDSIIIRAFSGVENGSVGVPRGFQRRLDERPYSRLTLEESNVTPHAEAVDDFLSPQPNTLSGKA